MKIVKFGLLATLLLVVQMNLRAQAFEAYEQNISGTEVSFKLTPIPGGTFLLGSPEGAKDREEDEGPQVKVKLDSFWMGVHEVTFQEYYIFREKTLDKAPEGSDWDADAVTRPSPPYEDPTFGMGQTGFPAGSMTQYGALSYCKWLTEKTGVFYRLPTEAEWEYACKAGREDGPALDNTDMVDDLGWYEGNSDEAFKPVGGKKPNPWGLYDMLGNVGEWTLDQYADDYYSKISSAEPVANPWAEPVRLHPRTVKGGSFQDEASELRCANRIKSDMDWKRRDPQLPKSFWWNTDSPFVGFRLVRPYKKMTQAEIDEFWSLTLDQ
ncbi:MAG: SUMF1/EgtB/PvdO family nonheme iron enzyme [Saprospiraceae bacterium]